MKKILFDARSLGKKPSGIGIYVYNMSKALAKDKDISLSLICDVALSDEIKELKDSGLKIYEYGKEISKSISLYSYYKFVQKCIDEEKPDVFWEGNNLVPIKIKNPYGKLIATIHDVFPVSHPQYYGKVYPLFFRYGLKKTIKNFDGFIYNSFDTKEEAEKYFPELKGRSNAVGYIIVPRLPKREITDNNSFLYIGNLEKRKGTDILLKAYKEYKENGGSKSLRLAGKVREDDIQALMDEVSNSVSGLEYLGYVSEEGKSNEYAACSAFLFPSKLEGFGIPVIEAMDYYKPIIASDLKIFKEIAGDNLKYIDHNVASLCNAMQEELPSVDKIKYDETINKYSEESIIKITKDYLCK